MRRPGIIHGSKLLKAGLPRVGFETCSWTSWETLVCRRLRGSPSPGTCARRSSWWVPTTCSRSTWGQQRSAPPWKYFPEAGGNVGVAGLVVNKDDGKPEEAAAFAEAVGIPDASAIPQHEDIRRRAPTTRSGAAPGRPVGTHVQELAMQVATAPPSRPHPPLPRLQLLDLFKGDAGGPGCDAYARHPRRTCGAGVRGAQDPRSGLRRGVSP